ncbi:MAG: hypothetical protein BWY19_01197 [bacterium ADurb.Bin212]|nr:MAG: hypothetical protein BWY19_01197 [bacterium ADurb.Bin212]
MNKKNILKPFLISLFAVIVIGGIATTVQLNSAKAEVIGDRDSGVTSRIKTIYDELVSLNYGSDTDSPDWGPLWNRIKTATKWVPGGNAAASDVKSGKTFYTTDRTEKTGTYPAPSNCPTQQYHDSYGAPVTQTTNCTSEVAWTTPSPAVTGDDKQDPRTGLIWSQLLLNSSGTVVFSPSANSNWSWDGTTNANSLAVGGKTASQLCSERGNGWRLPTQKELMQAYIDGSFFNLTQPSNAFWSATELSATHAWFVSLYGGATNGTNKSTHSNQVRCVR